MSQQCQAFMKKVDRKCKKSAKKGELFCFMHISDKISTNVEKQKLGLSMISDEKKIVLTEVDNKDEVSAGVGGLTTDELKIEIKDKTTDELKTGVGIDGKNKIETEIKDKGENKNKLYFDPKNIAISLEYYKKFVDDKTFIFIEKAIKVHGTRFDYTECKYVHSKTDVKIRCMIHGPYDQAPTTHLEGKKCRLCGNIEGGKKNKRKITTEQYIERCEKFHGKDKYDYSMTVYEAASKDVIIICKIHGPFSQRASTHYTSNCPDCVIEDNRKSDRKLTTAIFIERSKKVHGDRYDYSHADYVNCRTRVWTSWCWLPHVRGRRHMCAVMTNPDRPRWDAPPTTAQKVAAIDGLAAYCGALRSMTGITWFGITRSLPGCQTLSASSSRGPIHSRAIG